MQPIQLPNYMGCLMQSLILYEYVFQNPLISRQTVSLTPEKSTSEFLLYRKKSEFLHVPLPRID
jgi:hypothetical protein